ncbi:Malonate transporter, MadL subunit [hydrothermal vent metagenome]|uniref:Malonate transporter, MadL subunit n=1 Tax=hydrothermal vent metagenome TaxID=652676 RepID=A0A3B0SV23_9ZZZZ
MVIYGVAILAACTLGGLFLGDLLGQVLNVKANVGGVGFAMLFLIILANLPKKLFNIDSMSRNGIAFWSSLYIPIIVAMAAKQDVVSAVAAGPVAIAAGFLAVAASFAMIPIMMSFVRNKDGGGDK